MGCVWVEAVVVCVGNGVCVCVCVGDGGSVGVVVLVCVGVLELSFMKPGREKKLMFKDYVGRMGDFRGVFLFVSFFVVVFFF